MRPRVWLRDVVTGVMDRLPDAWFVGLRAPAPDLAESRWRRSARAAVMRVVRQRRIPEATFRPVGRDEVVLVAADSWMTRVLYWQGAAAYEGAEVEHWARACRRATRALELGASVGYYTVVGARANPSCAYVACEPHPGTAAVTRRNIEVNGCSNVRLVEAAVVGRPDVVTVELSTPRSDRHGLPAQAVVRDGAEGVGDPRDRETHRVPAVFIGDLLEGVDLVKLDIEGQEAEVLEAVLDRVIESGPVVFVEVRRADVPRLRKLIVDLVDGGYLAFAIGDPSLHLLPRSVLVDDAPLPRFGSRDLLLVRAGDAHLL